MRVSLFILLWLCCLPVLRAQDSIAGPILGDSVLIKDSSDPLEVDNFMEEGYYAEIPRINDIPKVDTASYWATINRYRAEEFNYDETSPYQISFLQKVWSRLQRWLANLFPDVEYFKFTDLIYHILGVVAVVLLVWIAYKTFFSGKRLLVPSDSEEGTQDEIRFVEKNLLDINLMDYIEKAKQKEDYVLAIRYLSLLNIQLLARRELFRWKYTKTSVELIEELQQTDLKEDFARTIRVFDRVWYGNTQLDRARYEKYASYFLEFQNKWR
ncbi:DUF4129 domain-containing protein [Sphingobacterium suaedae]|uniref:DUF4129 domain-containing protein n=1 Tax=Sphingobacterium suaedae TaxID=1686402 RepID=A0ABW5KMY5_9SPHI